MLPLQRFTGFIEQNGLFTKSSRLLVALSGGIDSVALVHLLKTAGYQFAIAHCNFQLRAEANADEDFCRQLALVSETPFYTIRFNTQQYATVNKISIQMAARQLRYQWFEQIRQQHGYDYIALAHHQNDTVETILLNLVRGTGIAGMHGILPKNGYLVRPMLCFTRTEIEQVLTENTLAYVEDSSNASVKYARNKIRHLVVPKLKELNPALEQTFESNLKHFRELEQLLELKVDEERKNLFNYKGEEISIAIDAIKHLNPQRLLLFKLLQPYGFVEAQVEDIIASLNKHAGRRFETAAGYFLLLDRGKVIIGKHYETLPDVTLTGIDEEVTYGSFKLSVVEKEEPIVVKGDAMKVSVDADKLSYPLLVRHWRQSDCFFPLGMRGRKKLSDFFVNLKVPLHKKNTIPLLVNGNGDIVWIGGYRLDDRYKVTNNTKKVTIFELLPV